MSRVIAAVTGDAAAPVVLSAAIELGELFAASVEALHVCDRHDAAASHASMRAHIALRTVPGEAAAKIVETSCGTDVAAVAIGSRGRAKGRRPAGSTAATVLAAAASPMVVLAPDTIVRHPIHRILVPLDGSPASTSALHTVLELSFHADLSILVAHIHPASRTGVRDRLPHEVRAWTEDFVAANCPPSTDVALEIRLGEPHQHILDICHGGGCDMVALGWSQHLGDGRAAVVAHMLSDCRLPVMLTPAPAGEPATANQIRVRPKHARPHARQASAHSRQASAHGH